MIVVDFFCGAGGLTRGLLDAGIRVLLGVDHDPTCRTTYEHNNPGVTFECEDITAFDPDRILKLRRGRTRERLMLVGCAPCQPFSRHNRSGAGDSSRTLLSAFGRIVEATRPEYILVENVPEMLTVPGNSTFRRFLAGLRKAGYQVVYGVLDAKHFGVPQTRRRLVLIGSRVGSVSLPKSSHGPGKRPYRTVRHVIAHYPPIAAGERCDGIPNHASANLSPLNLLRLESTPADGGDRRSWPPHLQLACHRAKRIVYTDTYGRLAWDRPAPTLTARCWSVSNGRYAHPVQNRAISLREAAALQSFPDGYEFFGVKASVARQIGNAVPPILGEVLGRHVLQLDAGLGRAAPSTQGNQTRHRRARS